MSTRDPAARQVLFEGYAHVAYSISLACASHEGLDEVEFEDCLHFGVIGLLEAIDRFDPAKGTRFDRYAVHRIRGSIMTGVESFRELDVERAASLGDYSPAYGIDTLEQRQQSDHVRSLIESRLGDQQRTVIWRHYFQELKFDEIAQTLGLTKGRVSQIHKAAITALHDGLAQTSAPLG